MPLSEREISNRIVRVLAKHNISTLAELLTYKKRDIGDLPGIGPGALEDLAKLVNKQGLKFAPDPYEGYNCFRHGTPYWDSKNRLFFLCKECFPVFSAALNNKKPTYKLPPIKGTCNQCNRHLENVKPFWWVLCEICDRVANSIGRGVEAQNYVKSRAITSLKLITRFKKISVENIQVPILNKFEENKQKSNSSPDLMIKENDEILFYIEVKTGQSSIGKTSIGTNMNRFQLDHQDIDDIRSCITRFKKPVFIFHVQCITRIDGPTNRHEPVDCWWATTSSLSDNYIESKTRPREKKIAAYFDISAFKSMDVLDEYLKSNDWKSWVKECEQGKSPKIYKLPKIK